MLSVTEDTEDPLGIICIAIKRWPVTEGEILADTLVPAAAVPTDDCTTATPEEVFPPTATLTLPDVAPLGTGTTMEVALQLVGVAVVLLNLTVLVPCDAPKFVPVIVTDVPTLPDVGERDVMLGDCPNRNSPDSNNIASPLSKIALRNEIMLL